MRFSQLEGKRVAVWGAGREVRAFAQALQDRFGQSIALATSDNAADRDSGLAESWVEPGDAARVFGEVDLVVRSPGVSTYRPELEALRQSGVPVTTATALWLAEPHAAPVIGVTGTKGKSTTASLLAHLLRASGKTVELAGNVGRPAIELAGLPEPDCYVLELSSYQSADLTVGVDVAVFTNLYPEHIDWHGKQERYFADKLRLAELAPVRTVVVNACDERLVASLATASAPVVEYGCRGAYTVRENGQAILRDGAPTADLAKLPLPGRHNLLNVCAAATAATAIGVDDPPLDALEDFIPLPHRLQPLGLSPAPGTPPGVEWVNDSISTTPESTLAALEALSGRDLVLIAGGFDRMQDYGELAAALAAREIPVIGLPATGKRLLAEARRAGAPADGLRAARDLDEAVRLAREVAKPGGAVLLSPAAASFGAFTSFEERGERFAALIAGG